MKNGSKPNVQEIGPMTFELTIERVNVSFQDDGKLVSYQQLRKWYFRPELSSFSLNESVYHLNAPLVITANYASKGGYFEKMFKYQALSTVVSFTESKLFAKHTIGELLFEGYQDSLLSASSILGKDVTYDRWVRVTIF